MSRDWPLFAADMLDFCHRITAYAEGLDFDALARAPKDRDALLFNIVLLGEAAAHIPMDIRAGWPAIPWTEIVATRNALVHGYFAISDRILRDIVANEVPALITQLARLVEQHPAD
ncbi:MAG: DUF86 domain-containing protein [Pseudomonadota bacterium]|nr:DUF86 domain-containing protein [Pseudomonadota bacterium]